VVIAPGFAKIVAHHIIVELCVHHGLLGFIGAIIADPLITLENIRV
jgi:hypothetical protein